MRLALHLVARNGEAESWKKLGEGSPRAGPLQSSPQMSASLQSHSHGEPARPDAAIIDQLASYDATYSIGPRHAHHAVSCPYANLVSCCWPSAAARLCQPAREARPRFL